MYVLFCKDVSYSNKTALAGEIYYVQIRGYHRGYSMFALTEVTDSTDNKYVIGSLSPDPCRYLDSQRYVLGSTVEMLQRIWISLKTPSSLSVCDTLSAFKQLGGKVMLPSYDDTVEADPIIEPLSVNAESWLL